MKISVGLIPFEFKSEEDRLIYRSFFNGQNCATPIAKQSATTLKPQAGNLWVDEAITYLGLDRIGLKRPDRAIHRLINKGALHPKKISGRLAFDRVELDMVLANGDQKRGRGRPRVR